MELSKYEIGKCREILCLPPRAVNDDRKRRRNPSGCRRPARVAPFSIAPGTGFSPASMTSGTDMSPTAMTPCTDVSTAAMAPYTDVGPTAYTPVTKDIGAIIMRVLHRIILYEYR